MKAAMNQAERADKNRRAKASAKDQRRSQLAAIHLAQKALGLTPEDAQALKISVTGVASSGDMSIPQLRRYLVHLGRLQGHAGNAGSKPGYAAQRPPLHRAVADGLDERWHKARAIWHELALSGLVHTDTDAALMAYVQRQCGGVEHWRFLNTYQVNSVIESLKAWQTRIPK